MKKENLEKENKRLRLTECNTLRTAVQIYSI